MKDINLNGPQGNAFFILGIAKKLCAQLSEIDPDKYNWDKIRDEMMSDDYDNLVQTFISYFGDYVDVHGDEEYTT